MWDSYKVASTRKYHLHIAVTILNLSTLAMALLDLMQAKSRLTSFQALLDGESLLAQ